MLIQRIFVVAFCTFILTAFGPAVAQAKRISAAKGKRYTIDKRHGPWMIMVTNLRGNNKESWNNAIKAADGLVYELRKKNLPAYVFLQRGQLKTTERIDRLGRRTRGAYAAQRNQIAIMAGNYSSIDPNTADGKLAQKTLEWIKNYRPKSLAGGVFRPTPGKPNPFSRAMLVPNPLLTPEEIQSKKDSKLLKYMNQGIEHSLTGNRGKFTLVVATFHGKSVSLKEGDESLNAKKTRLFEKNVKQHQNLNKAGQQAFQLVQLMRNQNKEAYVWHDRYQSYVTVGAFDDRNDPRIRKLYDQYCAKQREYEGRKYLVAESIQSKKNPRDKNERPMLNFVMDPQPRLMTVPQL